MSYDLMVFAPEAAPEGREAFMDWFRKFTKWGEEHDYDDPDPSHHRRPFENREIWPPHLGLCAGSRTVLRVMRACPCRTTASDCRSRNIDCGRHRCAKRGLVKFALRIWVDAAGSLPVSEFQFIPPCSPIVATAVPIGAAGSTR